MPRFLICPSFPTPNGRLHLGHMAGPYLSADILKRHLRRMGHETVLLGGFDTFEQNLAFRAFSEGLPPKELAARYQPLILQDLHAFEIAYDEWVDPLSEEHAEPLSAAIRGSVMLLDAVGAIEYRRENLLFDSGANRYLVGPWLKGQCPFCKADLVGFSCESCGQHVAPAHVLQPRPRLQTKDIAIREVTTPFFARPPQTDSSAPAVSVRQNPLCQNVVHEVTAAGCTAIRLAIPEDFGIPFPNLPVEGKQVCFTYSSLLSYSVYLGTICQRLCNLEENPFSRGSNTTTITIMGVDAITPRAIMAPLMARPAWADAKAFDWNIASHFYTLNGKKFSTSRQHAVWVGDLIEKARVPSDCARLFLCLTSPVEKPGDFNVATFIRFCREEYLSILAEVDDLCPSVEVGALSSPANSSTIEPLKELLKDQATALDPERFSLRDFARVALRWRPSGAKETAGNSTAYWRLKAFALLFFPIMPSISLKLWNSLGAQNSPSLEALEQRTVPLGRIRIDSPTFEAQDIFNCVQAA